MTGKRPWREPPAADRGQGEMGLAAAFFYLFAGVLIASAFMGFIIWPQGLSSSIALANTDPGSPINVIHQIAGITVPLRLTIFAPYSWVSVIVVLALLAVAVWRMAPEQVLTPDPAVFGASTACSKPLPCGGSSSIAAWSCVEWSCGAAAASPVVDSSAWWWPSHPSWCASSMPPAPTNAPAPNISARFVPICTQSSVPRSPNPCCQSCRVERRFGCSECSCDRGTR